MKRGIRNILFLCIGSVAGFILLQAVWLSNYYNVSKDRFEKDVNLAFEDAVKKEFLLRCDTLEFLMYKFLTDTSQIEISSQWINNLKVYRYDVINKNDPTDRDGFSLKDMNLPINYLLDSVYKWVARWYAHSYRTESLDQHIVFFNTQNIGKYIGDKAVNEFSFDTTRLRPIFEKYLAERNISEPFSFHYSDKDSLLNSNILPDTLEKKYKVVTKAFSTFKYKKGENFIRALFKSDKLYLLNHLKWMLVGAIFLLFAIAFSLYYLFKKLKEEKKLSAIKNDFISNITHELKTPVATVSGAIEALKHFDALQDPDKINRYLSISQNELQRLSSMIDQILYSSLYERQQFELQKEWVSIDEIINQVIHTRKFDLAKNVNFSYTNFVKYSRVYADRLHLFNSINNLIDNSIKYSAEKVNVKITVRQEEDKLVIMIADDGIGISEDYLPFVFDRFFRAPQGNRHKVKGYGLGLAYVKSVIEKHHGWCSVSSRLNKGTEFTIALPL